MEKTIYNQIKEDLDAAYEPRNFNNLMRNLSGVKVILADASKPFLGEDNYSVYFLDGVVALHESKISRPARAGLRADSTDIKVSLYGEEMSVIYVEKKIRDVVAKFKETKAKILEQLV